MRSSTEVLPLLPASCPDPPQSRTSEPVLHAGSRVHARSAGSRSEKRAPPTTRSKATRGHRAKPHRRGRGSRRSGPPARAPCDRDGVSIESRPPPLSPLPTGRLTLRPQRLKVMPLRKAGPAPAWAPTQSQTGQNGFGEAVPSRSACWLFSQRYAPAVTDAGGSPRGGPRKRPRVRGAGPARTRRETTRWAWGEEQDGRGRPASRRTRGDIRPRAWRASSAPDSEDRQ